MIYPMSPSGDQPWYHAGLRFTCTRCGNCCTGKPGYVWVTDEEIDAIARFRQESTEEVVGLYTKPAHRGRTLREKRNGDCVFYERDAGCTIYPVRPRQCRTWPFWESNVHTPQSWECTKEVCPGAGRGNLISAEEITQRMKTIPL
jgi:hypothetical protein